MSTAPTRRVAIGMREDGISFAACDVGPILPEGPSEETTAMPRVDLGVGSVHATSHITPPSHLADLSAPAQSLQAEGEPFLRFSRGKLRRRSRRSHSICAETRAIDHSVRFSLPEFQSPGQQASEEVSGRRRLPGVSVRVWQVCGAASYTRGNTDAVDITGPRMRTLNWRTCATTSYSIATRHALRSLGTSWTSAFLSPFRMLVRPPVSTQRSGRRSR